MVCWAVLLLAVMSPLLGVLSTPTAPSTPSTTPAGHAPSATPCCNSHQDGNSTGGNSTPPPPPAAWRGRGEGERWRRSATLVASGPREQRGEVRASLQDSLKNNFWPTRGRRSTWQSLRALDSAEDPFWAARGRRDSPPWRSKKSNNLRQSLGSAEDPFWAARGRRDGPPWRSKKDNLRQALGADNFWAARGKKFLTSAEVDPFWASRGKKLASDSEESPFWAARGKKMAEFYDSSESPFWAARGKKLTLETIESGEDPFWAARGKKKLKDSSEEPFYAARGKKDNDSKASSSSSKENPFFASRGRRTVYSYLRPNSVEEGPFWGSRGKKSPESVEEGPFLGSRGKKSPESVEEGPFWGSRGRRTGSQTLLTSNFLEDGPFWGSRGKKNAPDPQIATMVKPRENRQKPAADNFWPVRGKRPHQEEVNSEDEAFWSELANKSLTQYQDRVLEGEGDGSSIPEVLAQFFGIPTKASIKTKKQNTGPRALVVNPMYSTDFWAVRG